MTDAEGHLQHGRTIAKTIFGSASLGLGAGISFLSQVEIGLRITSLVIGIAIGALTLRNLWRNRNRT